jgi:hypothetical protein
MLRTEQISETQFTGIQMLKLDTVVKKQLSFMHQMILLLSVQLLKELEVMEWLEE